MTDEQHAQKIHRLVRDLKEAVEEAGESGLRVRLRVEVAFMTDGVKALNIWAAEISRETLLSETFTEEETQG